MTNADQSAQHINQVTVQAGQLMTDLESRDLPAKLYGTITGANGAVDQLKLPSETVNATLISALGPDQAGHTAADNLCDSLSNIDLATANIQDDTEALKHGFLFRGYFKKRGFYSLHGLSAGQYRSDKFFQNLASERVWLGASTLFQRLIHLRGSSLG